MPVRELEYGGMVIRAGAFEVIETKRFIVSVGIARVGDSRGDRKVKFFEPPSEDGFFDGADEALEAAICFARAIIDGEIPGLTVRDL
jgi:hypothetical protein